MGPPGHSDPYGAHHPPPPGPYGPGPGAGGYPPPFNPDEVRTLFITGFPADVKERELNNMLRFLPGYEVRSDG